MIKMIVFLGNPGNQYEKTRHNAGWMFEKSLNNKESIQNKFKAIYYRKNDIIYLLPQTFMNLSGESVIKAMQFFKLQISEILVIHDDLELEFGTIKIREGGGLGGHNGLKSINSALGSPQFNRLSIGISRPLNGSVASYVLQRFSKDEEAELDYLFENIQVFFVKYINGNFSDLGKKITIIEKRG